MKNEVIDQLISDEKKHLEKLHQIVEETIKAEELIVKNLLNPTTEIITTGQKISDKVVDFLHLRGHCN